MGEFEFQVDGEYFFSIREGTMQSAGNTYAKTLLMVDLKFILNWESYILSDHSTTVPIFFFVRAHGMQKFPGKGWNLHHSSDLSHSSDNTRSLTSQATRELPLCLISISVLSK